MASYNKNYILQTARDFDGNHSKVLKEYKDMTTEWIENMDNPRFKNKIVFISGSTKELALRSQSPFILKKHA